MNGSEWLLSFARDFIQGALYLLCAPLVLGTLRWSKARLQRRQGPRLFQPYFDLYKLLGKRPVTPAAASWLFRVAPFVLFTCYAMPGFLIPVIYLPAGGSPLGADLLFLVYLLALAKFTMALAGQDAGAPFGGLGSSREMFVHALAEPGLLIIIYALALRWRTTSLTVIVQRDWQTAVASVLTDPILWLALLALAITALAETGRLPFDNPASHLELTMFSQAIYLEYAGPYLALIEWAEALRLAFFFTLLADLLAPWLLATPGSNFWLNSLLVLAYPLKLLLLTLLLAVWETTQVKLRLRAIVGPVALALFVALITSLVAVITR